MIQSKALLKPVVFSLCLLPLAWMVYDGFTGGLGVNPIEAVTHRTGDWTLRLLLATLTLTPLRRLSGWAWPLRLRRMVGLFAFFYACLHLLTYLWLDQFFAWGMILEDVVERPFITLGMLAFLGLVPLALTSTRGMQRRLGRRWKTLHRLVYPVAILGVLHFWWLVKADVREPLVYALVLAVLLGVRLAGWWRRGAAARARAGVST
ncbi:MAG: sulfoxide reductase heme-binding subunit YedZ [Gammaproteobacteria bacterium]|nr:sulfoxide reductase heme-binding subunit YedZ [Gammaproteobacteria bacterium]MDX5374616.1 sulfoxide reductase heme-binding subunit YedZ [Gammaproteobacteria bacterium]